MNIQFNQNDNFVIDGNEIHPDIFQQEMTEYYASPRSYIIDNLIDWISEAGEADKSMMKDDLRMLMNETDEICLQSISTNHYLFKNDPQFADALAEIIEADVEYRANSNTNESESVSIPETNKEDALTQALNDIDFYDFFTNAPTLSGNKWNDAMSTIVDKFDITNEVLGELETQLFIFSLLYDVQYKNPDWISLQMSKRIELTQKIYSSLDSLDGDNYDENINRAISRHIDELRSKTTGLILKTNSGSSYKDGFTVSITDADGDYVASIELYNSTDDSDAYTNIKISSDFAADDSGYDRLLVLKAISMHESKMVEYNPCAQLMDSAVLQPAIRTLRKAELIIYYNDSFFLTDLGQKSLDDRDFDSIRFPIKQPARNTTASSKPKKTTQGL
jgi:hypothetical protein